MDDYSEHPKSISEIKYDKEANWGLLTPREQLIKTLRQIDNGEIKPTDLVVAYFEDNPDEPLRVATSYHTAACRSAIHSYALIGRLTVILHLKSDD